MSPNQDLNRAFFYSDLWLIKVGGEGVKRPQIKVLNQEKF